MANFIAAASRRVTCSLLAALAPIALAQEPEPDDDDDDERPEIHFQIPEVEAHPGDTVSLPFTVDTTAPLSMAAFSVQHDPSALRLREPRLSAEVEAVLALHPEADSQFIWFADEAAGWLQVAIVLDFLARETITIPVGSVPVATLQVDVDEQAAEGRYELAFATPETAELEGHFEDPEGNPVFNSARREGVEFEEETEFEDEEDEEPNLTSGAILVSIIGDVSVFFRGDANADRRVDISDAVYTLGHLFLGDAAPPCADAADANDDGALDLSDSVSTLHYLFISAAGSSIKTWARDPTPDELGCNAY